MKTRYTVIALAAIILAGVAAWMVLGSSSEKPADGSESKPKKIPVVAVAEVSRTTICRRLELTGSAEPYRLARLASPAEGPVENIRVREGDRVTAGQTLLSIGRKQGAEALIASLQEELEKEADNLRRVRQLVQNSALPAETLDDARTAVENIRAQLVRAEESGRDYTITAPWSGVVSRLHVKEGQFAAPRTILMEMYDPDSIVIRAAIPERHAPEVKAGMQADIRLDAYPGQLLPGRIERVYPYLESRLRTRTVEMVPESPVDLLPGMFARIELLLEKAEDVVVVPTQAIVETPEGKAVYMVFESRAVKRSVQTGIREENRIEIRTGISAGDRVVVEGHQVLKTGTAVRVAGKKPESGSKPSEAKAQRGAEKGDRS